MRDYANRTSFRLQRGDATDKWMLAFAFVLGISGSLALKAFGLSVWIPAAYSATVIIIYSLAAYLFPSVQLESDQVGDNAYYLGFVLTLTSLSFTLYELSRHVPEADFIADVIAGFGVALSSTIVGVSVRVMFLQFRLDLVARDREARLALNDAMRNFRVELADVIRGTKYLGVEIRQSLLEYHDEIAKAHKDAARNLYSELLIAFREALDPLQKRTVEMTNEVLANATAATNASADAREKSLAALASGVEDASSRISGSMTKLTDSVSASMSLGMEKLTRLQSEFVRDIEETSRQAVEQREKLERSAQSAVDQSIADFSKTTQDVRDGMKQFSDQIHRNMDVVSEKTQVLASRLQYESDTVFALSAAQIKRDAEFTNQASGLVHELSQIAVRMKDMHTESIATNNALTSAMSAHVSELQQRAIPDRAKKSPRQSRLAYTLANWLRRP